MSATAALLLGFPDYDEPARRLAAAAGLEHATVAVHHFPDGESRVRLPPALPERVVLCRSLHRPNDKLLELRLAAAAARELGARHLTLVAPYLCYMRQDTAFRPGEAVSQRIVGAELARAFDAVITVDPHLHRTHRLADAVPAARAVALSAAASMGRFLAERTAGAFVLGPDAESRQWVEAVAAAGGLDHAVATKTRHGDRRISIALPDVAVTGRDIILVDDMISTGHTLEETARGLARLRPRCIGVLVTHALCVENALARLMAAGVNHVWSTDSVPHESNAIELAGLLADALR